jgi:hypothetical protein
MSANGATAPRNRPQVVQFACRYGDFDRSTTAVQGQTAMNGTRPAKTNEERQGPGREFEGEMREIIRRDVVAQVRQSPPAEGEAGVDNLSGMIERVAVNSAAEIDKLISELQQLRDFLFNEGQRVQREIAGYAQLSQTAMNSTRVITENLSQWQGAVEAKRTIDNGGSGSAS